MDLGPSGDLEGGFPAWSFEGEATFKLGVAVRFLIVNKIYVINKAQHLLGFLFSNIY